MGIRFNSRDKKPKVWNIAILSIIAVILVAILARDPDHIPLLTLNIIIVIHLILTLVFLIIAFFHQLQYNPYSYNSIYYAGFTLFLLTVLITHIVAMIRMLRFPNVYDLSSVLSALVSSARNYMLLSAPFVLVFSVALFISNISLLKHEGKRFHNFLGMILAVLMVAGEVFLFFADYYVSGSYLEIMIHSILINLFASFYLYFESMVIGSIIINAIVAKYEPEKEMDYILILGCSLRRDGTPTPLLAGRIDRALGFYRKQIEETGKVPYLIPSGGQGNDERHSESEAMAEYLLAKGVPEEHILKEDQSRNTYENMQFSKEIIDARQKDAKVAFSTTNYHVFRSGIYARRAKMKALGMGASTKWYFWPNAAVREFVGVLKYHKVKQALILIGMIVIYTGLTILAYH
ncbi:MAG: YdcF family protein [Lachnospiraceae bacterium]|nr:YdcF family protein [Lachnospiraceae bacterium]